LEELKDINVDEKIKLEYNKIIRKLGEIDTLLKRISYLESELQKIKYKVPLQRLKEIEEEEKKLLELEKLKKEKEILELKIKEYDEKVLKLSELKSKVNPEIEKEYSIIEQKLREIEKEISKISGKITEMEGRIKDLETKERQLSILEEKKKKWEKLLEKLTRLVNKLSRDGLPKILRENALNYINEVANIYLKEFTDKYYIDIDLDLNIYALPIDRVQEKIEARNLSGGEKVMFSLSIALALLSWLSVNNKFLVLDEPLANLDNERALALTKIFEKLENIVEQALIVTHNENLDNGQFNVIRV